MKILFTVILMSACFAANAEELKVVSWSPSGENAQGGVSQIAATFNKPMVSLSAPSEAASYCPMEIVPPVKGRCRWLGTQTLVFEPEAALTPASRYDVIIAAGTKSKVSGDEMPYGFGWSFALSRPQLKESKPENDAAWIDINATLFGRFTLPMQQARMRDFVELEERGANEKISTINVGIRHATLEEIQTLWGKYVMEYDKEISTSNVMAFKPSRQLHPDSKYRLIFKKDMPAESGNLGFAAESAVNFSTWKTFAFKSAAARQCLPADLVLGFSNPVRYGDLIDNLTLYPSTPLARPSRSRRENSGEMDAASGICSSSIDDVILKPGQTVKFRISGKLKDIFGNSLGKDIESSVVPPDYCSRLNMAEGFGIMEKGGKPRHPVTAINVMSAELQKLHVVDDEIIPLYNEMSGEAKRQWYADTLIKNWQPNDKRNVSVRTFVDLSGKGGVVFLRVKHDDKWYSAADNITRLGLLFKTSPENSLVWASYLKTGSPAVGVPVQIRDDNNKILWKGATDNEGFALAPGWGKLAVASKNRWSRPRLWVMAQDPQGTAVLASDFQGGIEPWRFNVATDYSPSARHYQGIMYAERGVYRPGESVDFKGVFRKSDNGDWAYPDLKVVKLTVRDARGTEVYNATAPVSALGSFDFTYPVSASAPTGSWTAPAPPASPGPPLPGPPPGGRVDVPLIGAPLQVRRGHRSARRGT